MQLKLDESKGSKLSVIIQGELRFEGWKVYKKKFTKNEEFKLNASELHSDIVKLLSVGKQNRKIEVKFQI